MWTRDSLQELVRQQVDGYPFLVVSNREPYVHTFAEDGIQCDRPVGGLTTALDPVMQACGGTWIAHGSGDADYAVVDSTGKVLIPPQSPRYTLRRIRLSPAEEEGYYCGFANQALWPLCHLAYTRPLFRQAHWETYKAVNERFADAVLDEIGDGLAFVFVQDYHLALLPRLLKERNPRAIIAQFWHIPWPNREVFRICPWLTELLDGLLGNDLLGFHIQYYCNNFLETVDRTLEARVDYDRSTVTYRGKTTLVRPFPISIDFEQLDREARQEVVETEMARLRRELGLTDQVIGLGLDRVDYTKGIPERLLAFQAFLKRCSAYHGKVVFIEAGVPSREKIDAYKRLGDEVEDLIETINSRFGTERWRPVVYIRQNLPPPTLHALRRLAHFAVVSSLHDGMNLVAKEYVASRFDEDGVLILSPFTGAAWELTDALIANPYATEEFAEAIRAAIEMPAEERQYRMHRLRQQVEEQNIYAWAAAIISELVKLGPRE